jgi:hypothetical protein
MSRKFYKLLIIGNPQAAILHIPNRNNGIMECWNREIIAFYAVICQGRKLAAKPVVPIISAVGVYLPMFHKGAIPLFHFSNIPSFQLRSEAELSSNFLLIGPQCHRAPGPSAKAFDYFEAGEFLDE